MPFDMLQKNAVPSLLEVGFSEEGFESPIVISALRRAEITSSEFLPSVPFPSGKNSES